MAKVERIHIPCARGGNLMADFAVGMIGDLIEVQDCVLTAQDAILAARAICRYVGSGCCCSTSPAASQMPSDAIPIDDSRPCGDPVVEKVVARLRKRSLVGQWKYGSTLAGRDDLVLRDWVLHVLEEVLDQANYLQVILDEIARTSDDGK